MERPKINKTLKNNPEQKKLEFQFISLFSGVLCYLTACYPVLSVFFVVASLGVGIYTLKHFGPNPKTIIGMVLSGILALIWILLLVSMLSYYKILNISIFDGIFESIKAYTGVASEPVSGQ